MTLPAELIGRTSTTDMEVHWAVTKTGSICNVVISLLKNNSVGRRDYSFFYLQERCGYSSKEVKYLLQRQHNPSQRVEISSPYSSNEEW
jgi:hypothetical protein